MKAKYLLGVALCCFTMIACQPNDPDKNMGNDNKTNNESIEGLSDITDGIGNIVDTKTLDDGSTVMKDDNGNTITKDKEGNITIVTKEGETILIDNSIKEDKSAPKDKWYNSTWKNGASNEPESPYIDMDYRKKQFIETLKNYGFVVEEVKINKDSTEITNDELDEYTLHFRYTTASLKKESTSTQYTSKGTYHFIRYDVKQKEIGDGEIRYRFEIVYNEWGRYDANLYEDTYYYDSESESYILMDSRNIDGVGLGKDDAICTYDGYDNNSTKEEVLSKNVSTTYFNYRRMNETQIAASNNTASYILKDDEGSTPQLEAYDLNGNHLISFDLVSFQ